MSKVIWAEGNWACTPAMKAGDMSQATSVTCAVSPPWACQIGREGLHRAGSLPCCRKERLAPLQVHTQADSAMPPTAAGLIHPDLADGREVFVGAGPIHVVVNHPPQPRIMHPEQCGNRGHRHLAHEDHDQGFTEPGTAAVRSGPGDLHGFDPTGARALDARRTGMEVGLEWKKFRCRQAAASAVS